MMMIFEDLKIRKVKLSMIRLSNQSLSGCEDVISITAERYFSVKKSK